MSLLINQAFAAETTIAAAQTTTQAAAQQPAAMSSSLIFMLAFVAMIYFLIWRPQSKRAKEHRDLMSNLKTGDEVVTSGGIVGKITKVTDEFVTVNVAQNSDLTLQKHAIVSVLPKGTLAAI